MDVPEAHAGGKPDLFSKVGPLPAWAWGAIVVVAFLAYRRFSAKTPAAVDPANLVTDATTPASDSWGSSGGSGGSMGVDPSSASYNYADALAGNYTGTTSGAVFDTNQQWGVYAVNNLPKLGFSASDVVSAITFYLAGMPLTDNQVAIINAAIGHFGSPPLPMPAVSTPSVVAAPTTDPVVAPAPANAVVSDPVMPPTESAPVPVISAPDPTPVPSPAPYVPPYVDPVYSGGSASYDPYFATNVQPAYQSAPVSADYFTGSQPNAVLGIPAGARYLGTLSEAAQQTVLNGGTILSGGKIPMKLVPGTNYLVPA